MKKLSLALAICTTLTLAACSRGENPNGAGDMTAAPGGAVTTPATAPMAAPTTADSAPNGMSDTTSGVGGMNASSGAGAVTTTTATSTGSSTTTTTGTHTGH